jgi:pimeloyl-ACP methyl ester carboxylesterase
VNKEFVLVHGAWHGAWCWEAVEERLAARGHRVVALDLPGHGRRAGEHAKASASGYARAVVDAMALGGISRGIVVGHSMAGLVIPKVAEIAPERVAHLVFLAAVVVPDGGSLSETHLVPPVRAMIRGLTQARGNGTFAYPAEMAWARWMNDLPRDHPAVQAALARLTPQPLRPFVESVHLKCFYAMRVPRTYIRCLKDLAVPPDRALIYARRLGVKPIDLDAGHDAMLSQPEAVTQILDRL